ncbi:hypothetical protein KAU45_08970, partial [bacterium]|nr:hypothetical protein [bacterium]
MKRLILCILTFSAASVYCVDLDVAADPVTNQNIIGVINDEGRFYRHYGTDLELELGGYIEKGSKRERGEILRWDPSSGYYIQGKRWAWITSGDRCPGMGPYELLLHTDQRTENWNFFALDGEGQLYTITNVSWNPKGEPVPGPPPYHLTGASDPSIAGVFPTVLDGAGHTWSYIWMSGTWESYPLTGTYTGAAPTDFIAVTSHEIMGFGKTLFALVNETGQVLIHGEEGGDWVEDAVIQGGDAPFRFDGFIKSSTGGYGCELKLIDNNGQFFLPQDGEFKAYGEPCGGTPPWDLAIYRMERRGTHLIFCVDSTGALFLLRPNGEWEPLIRSFE